MSQIHIKIELLRLNITHLVLVKIRHYYYFNGQYWLKSVQGAIDEPKLCVTFNVNLLNKSYM
ncbi:hypothetical protein PAUR_b0821 [Pseudoalteromonas aurantia 208]|uniref:Uncharacterized protein n=1 Tax=Pseudoalteromonas aurantia 208 TaxID=1314867 RepID=A0ABR9EIA9_9GAMM|nr:hypothetical protein [Pseudoalteromonas aurantia 208]